MVRVKEACYNAGTLDAHGISVDPLREDEEEFLRLAVKAAGKLEKKIRDVSILLCTKEEFWDQDELEAGLEARILLEFVVRGLDRLLAINGHDYNDHEARSDFDKRMRACRKKAKLKKAKALYQFLLDMPRVRGWIQW